MPLEKRRRGTGLDWRIFAGLLAFAVLILVVGALYLWSSSSRLGRAAEALKAGDEETASALLEKASRAWTGKARALEGLGLLDLRAGDVEAGRERLEQAAAAGGGSILEDPAAELAAFVGAGDYAAASVYAAYLDGWLDQDDLAYWHAVALAGLQRHEEAVAQLEEFRARLGPVGATSHAGRTAALKRYLDRLGRGRHYCLLDRDGRPIHGFETESGKALQGTWPISTLTGAPTEEPGGGVLHGKDVHNHVLLTLDSAAQQAAHGALGRRAGTFVVLDIRSGDILAAASRPSAEGGVADGEPPWTALRHQYKPGSIVKLFTWSAALRTGADLERVFPLDCRGNDFVVDGRVLYDWKPHGTVRDAAEASAVSCNTAFGKMSFLVGEQALAEELRLWGFGAPLSSPLAPMETGRIWEDPLVTDFEVARAAIGLDHVTMTALHGAMLAAAVANEGVMPRPRLLLEKRNILGDVYERTEAGEMGRVAAGTVTRVLAEGMEAAVRGGKEATAWRLAEARVSSAVKTGTSGSRKEGLDTIMIGYLPAERPRIAFGLIIEKGGLAGIEGTRAVRRFIDSWYQRGGGLEKMP